MPTVLIRRIHTLSTQSDAATEWRDAALFVRGGLIEWVGPDAELPLSLHSADEIIDGRDLLVVPGTERVHPDAELVKEALAVAPADIKSTVFDDSGSADQAYNIAFLTGPGSLEDSKTIVESVARTRRA